MAIVKINPIEIEKRNSFSNAVVTANEVTAVDATDGAYFDMNERDDKYVIMIKNTASSEGTFTVKAGNGIQGVYDLVETIPANSTKFLTIDSGHFKNVSGDNKGRVIFKASANTIKVAVILAY